MSERQNPGTVDELRARLRELGYLNAGVDRFVLAPVREARPPGAVAWQTSVRVGVLGALLLGPSVAIGVAVRLPALVTGPRDAVVVALLLSALFGAAVTVVSLLAAAVSRRLFVRLRGRPLAGSRARRAAQGAGAIVALATLVYLTLWWRVVESSPGSVLAWSWTGAVLLLAVVISSLLGHAAATAAFAQIAAGTGTGLEPRRGLSWRASLGVGALAFAGASALLIASAGGRPAGAVDPTDRLVVVPTGARVKVIAIDGFDVALFDRLDSTTVPRLSAPRPGATGRFRLDEDRDPVRVWTTVATGQPPAVHGLEGLETVEVAGLRGRLAPPQSNLASSLAAVTDLLRLTRPALSSGEALRAPAFWEVAASAGLRTAVINWWATWPAPASAGIVLTDRTTLRLEAGGTLDREVAPTAFYDELQRTWPDVQSAARAAAAGAFGDLPEAVRQVVARSAELDATQVGFARLPAFEELDLLVVYLPGLDIAQTSLLGRNAPDQPSALAVRLDALSRYYVFLDRALAPLLDGPPDEVTMIVTSPGRLGSAVTGRLTMSGPGVGTVATSIAPTDLAPTVLYLLGLPLSRSLAGTPALELLAPDFVNAHPARFVAGYERQPSVDAAPARELDEEMRERLRSLGYVR